MSEEDSAEAWWGVRLLFGFVHVGKPQQDALLEEQVRVVRASSEDEAVAKAARIGSTESHQYQSVTGEDVRFTFREVLHAAELFDDELKEGLEVYSHFLGWTEVQQVRRMHRPASMPESEFMA